MASDRFSIISSNGKPSGTSRTLWIPDLINNSFGVQYIISQTQREHVFQVALMLTIDYNVTYSRKMFDIK